jgi:hypothetical protein
MKRVAGKSNSRSRGTGVGVAAWLFSLLVSVTAQAGPWTKNLGEFYLKLAEGFFIANSFVDASGNLVSGARYLGATTSAYGEIGIYRGLQLQLHLPYTYSQNRFDAGGSVRGAVNVGGGDATFAVQATPISLPFPWAVRAEIKVPFYQVGGVTGPNAASFPALGDGQLDFTFLLSAGLGLSVVPLYFFAEVGYRHRTEVFVGAGNGNRFADGIVINAQVGYTLFQRLLVAANLSGTIPFDQSSSSLEGRATKGYLMVGPSLYVPVYRGLALEASFDPIVWSRNSAAGFGLGFGLSYKR